MGVGPVFHLDVLHHCRQRDTAMKHPAKFSPAILRTIKEMVGNNPGRVLDPFAGTGLIHTLGYDSVGLEIEPEWAGMHPRTVCGDALSPPFARNTFDWVITSPCYGNRMADHHNARDGSRRMTYRHILGRELAGNSSAGLQWGQRYRDFHRIAWARASHVLKPGGGFLLNCKDHIRAGVLMEVTAWHVMTLQELGFIPQRIVMVDAPGMRFGQNGDDRTADEYVISFILTKEESTS